MTLFPTLPMLKMKANVDITSPERRVATPPPGGPADLGRVRRSSGIPVLLARKLSLPVVLLPVWGNTHYRYTGAQLLPGPSQI